MSDWHRFELGKYGCSTTPMPPQSPRLGGLEDPPQCLDMSAMDDVVVVESFVVD